MRSDAPVPAAEPAPAAEPGSVPAAEPDAPVPAAEPANGLAAAAPDEQSREDRPLPAVVTGLGVILYLLIAILAATLAVLLVPLRVGTVLLPVSVLIGAATNVALPLLVRRLADRTLVAALPIAVWFIALALLAGSRPEGDVLVPGGTAYAGLTYVFYALAIVGVVAGGVTLVRSDTGRTIRVVVPVTPGPSRPERPAKRR